MTGAATVPRGAHEHDDRRRPLRPGRNAAGGDPGRIVPGDDPGRRRQAARRARPHLALLRRRRAELRPHEGRAEAARAPRRAQAEGRLLPHPQPPEHRRRHPRPQVGEHQRLHRGRRGPPRLRLDRRRPHLRHRPRAGRAALRRDRLHAQGPVDEARPVPARVEAGASPTTTSTPAGPTRPEGLREVGGARLPVGEALRREVRSGRGRDLVLGDLERGQHRLLAGHARGVPEAPRRDDRRRPAGASRGEGRRARHGRVRPGVPPGLSRALPRAGHAPRLHRLPRQGPAPVRGRPRPDGHRRPARHHRPGVRDDRRSSRS